MTSNLVVDEERPTFRGNEASLTVCFLLMIVAGLSGIQLVLYGVIFSETFFTFLLLLSTGLVMSLTQGLHILLHKQSLPSLRLGNYLISTLLISVAVIFGVSCWLASQWGQPFPAGMAFGLAIGCLTVIVAYGLSLVS